VQTQPKTSLRLFVLGATGGIGRAIVDQGLERGHSVTAFVRWPEKMGPARDGLTVLTGDPRQAGALRAAMPGHDAVLSSLGPPGLGATTVLRDCARSSVAAMEASKVHRLLIVSAAMLFRGHGFFPWFVRTTFLRNVAVDSEEMERVVETSSVEWTIARPPRLTNGPLTRRYQVADGTLPRGGMSLPRADVAHFLLDEAERGGHVGKIVGMAAGKRSAAEVGSRFEVGA
jgi:putative NADH-flavin reductase